MPELPEIETLKRCLESKIIGYTISEISITRKNLRYELSDTIKQNSILTTIIKLRRRAKYLIIDLNNGYSLIVHLGMSGRFTLQSANYHIKKHDHVIFMLQEGDQLIFNDPRRFGMIYNFQTELLDKKIFSNLGIEPLSDNFNREYLSIILKNHKIPIKNILMNNHIIVGIGNIYANESLFIAKIHPTRISNSLTKDEITNLVLAIKDTLTNAILVGGTTLKDFVSGDNKIGYFQQQLLIYGRRGQKCTKCNIGIINKIIQSGRVSFYCNYCQQE